MIRTRSSRSRRSSGSARRRSTIRGRRPFCWRSSSEGEVPRDGAGSWHYGRRDRGAGVTRVRGGIVLVSFAGRPGLCGAENGMIRFGERMYSFNGSIGRFSGHGPGCFAGPVQGTIGRAAGETVSIRTRVGRRGAAAADETDLGVVSAPEAAAYFFSQSRLNLGQRNAEQALIAAFIAASPHVTAPLTRVIREKNPGAEARGL